MHVQAHNPDSTSYFIHGATASVCSAVFDSSLPFIMVEAHRPLVGNGASVWNDLPAPLSTLSAANPQVRRVRHLTLDVLMRTVEFFAALPEFEPSGMIVSQWLVEPNDPIRIGDHMFKPHLSRLMTGKGAVLAFLLPHKNETSQVFGPDTAVVARSHQRVTAWLNARS